MADNTHSKRILSSLDFPKDDNIRYPANRILVKKTRVFIFNKLNSDPVADGILISIVKTTNGSFTVRISKYKKGPKIKKGFVLLRDILEQKLLSGDFDLLLINICPGPPPYLLILGGSDGVGDEGIKVKIPT
ncbi:hypothetical protein [Dyadobacter frigoris]|uniref:Uncharacterized protein n=1 Tax=Dyadobacter frigoris TaxID=2576211 RepID=A0A4U6D5W8_9BACT|nr:hypothetical protein [Dyadobacter frigoris]TKT92770.1 hypothetical protein FDK13_08175 [Dyadobacter frigoris]GLU51672.1 hypothetical protein Dfri01_11330 [Dyadobacter frigoris]